MSKAKVHSAPAGAVGFDTDTVLTSATAAAFVQAKFHFAIRYLSRGSTESSSDLTSGEAASILDAGLALMAVQHASSSGWVPTSQLGTQYGQTAAQNAESVGLPSGMLLWLDLEGVATGSSASAVSAYCNAWFTAVTAAGYLPGLYVGAGSVLNADQLEALEVQYFWKSGSNVAYPSTGFCMVQSISSSYVLDGVAYDRDIVQDDNLGNTPLCLANFSPHEVLTGAKTFLTSAAASLGSHEAATSTAITSAVRSSWPRSGWLAAILAGVLCYAAGVYTGPMVFPAKRGEHAQPKANAAPQQAPVPPAEPKPASAPSEPAPAPAQATPVKPISAPAKPPVQGAVIAKQPDAAEPPVNRVGPLALLVGSFSEGSNATRLANTLENGGYGRPQVSQFTSAGHTWHVVRLGPYPKRIDAAKVASQLKEEYDLQVSILSVTR